jgi:hypothetical protein
MQEPLFKVMKVALPGGKIVPCHFASFDAFIIVEKGRAVVGFEDRGEANNRVTSMATDGQGVRWFATIGGVS